MKRWLALSAAVVLGSVGCAGCAAHIPPIPDGSAQAEPPVDLPSDLELEVGVPFRRGNRIAWAENGKVFHEIAEAIRRAKTSVDIVTFIWRPGEPSDEVLAPLVERAKAGVACRVLVDGLGSRKFAGRVQPILEAAGCRVLIHQPREDDMMERNHRKIVVVDGEVAITGGFGIWKSWLGNGRTKDEWRDSNVVIEGPVVRDLQRAFEASWVQAGGQPLPPRDVREPPRAGKTPAAFVASGAEDLDGGAPQTHIERATILCIRSARKRLWIANSYFLPSTEILSLLVAKAKAGVDVRVLAPGPIHDWHAIRAAQRDGYPELVAAGVQIYEYQASMMHSKTMLVDDHLVMVGSSNLDPLSLRQMEEGSLVLDDRALAAELEKNLQADFGFSKRITHPTAGPYAWASRVVLWMIGKL